MGNVTKVETLVCNIERYEAHVRCCVSTVTWVMYEQREYR